MEKISFDSGIREFSINGVGTLRFNPSDPNVYQRFSEVGEKIRKLETGLGEEAGKDTCVPALLAEADRQMKALLSWVFGPGNDFDAMLEGVNLLAVAGNGRQVIENLFAALTPVLTDGARQYARRQVEDARAKAKMRRESQG